MATSTISKVASSKNGLIQIGNIVIQYGRASATTAYNGSSAFPYRGSQQIAFEKPFASVPTVVANCEDWSSFWTASATGVGRNDFVIELSGNSNNTTKTVSWVAIGTI